MKRRKLLLGLALAAPPLAAAPTVDAAEFERRIERFNAVWGAFYRVHNGCPAHAKDWAECDGAKADADYAGFLKAAKEARKLFALDECR